MQVFTSCTQGSAKLFSLEQSIASGPLADIIRVWRVSGEELAAIRSNEVFSVKDLRKHLCKLHGFPTCIQVVLYKGNTLHDSVRLETSIDVQLVLVPLSYPSERQLEAANELTDACAHGQVEVVQLLMQAGVDKNLQDGLGEAALIRAARAGRLEIMHLLLEAYADKDLQDNSGDSALISAAEAGHCEIVCCLLETGADKNLLDRNRDKARTCAARNGHVEIVELLTATAEDQKGQSHSKALALFEAANNGNVQDVQLVLEAGADKDLRYEDDITLLVLATASGHTAITHLLLKARADTDLRTRDGTTALVWAAENGHTQTARLLLDARAQCDLRTISGKTALMHAQPLPLQRGRGIRRLFGCFWKLGPMCRDGWYDSSHAYMWRWHACLMSLAHNFAKVQNNETCSL